jgi:hypothetical protein
MAFSLVIFENSSEDEPYPVVATRDPSIIAIVRRLLMDRLADERPKPLLHLQRPQNPHNHRQGQQGEADA